MRAGSGGGGADGGAESRPLGPWWLARELGGMDFAGITRGGIQPLGNLGWPQPPTTRSEGGGLWGSYGLQAVGHRDATGSVRFGAGKETATNP
jgi:hypothetical protein